MPSRPRFEVVRAVVRRDYEILRSYPAVFGFEIVLGSLAILIYYFISRTFNDVSVVSLGGARNYFDFAVVGVAITAVMQTASVGLGQRLREEQLTGTLEAFVAQPVSTIEMCLGLVGYPFTLAALRAVIYLLIANVLLGADFSGASWLGFSVAMLATAGAISTVGLIVGACVLVIKRADLITGMIVFGLAIAGGAYFPRSVLPGWADTASQVVPTRFAYDAVRNALYRGDHWLGPTGVLGLFTLLGLPLGIWLFGRALRFSQARGSLTQY